MTPEDEEFERIAQRQLAELKKSTKVTTEDAAVRAVHKVMAEFNAKSDHRLMESPPEHPENFIDALKFDVAKRDSEAQQAYEDAFVNGTGVMLGDKRIDPASIYKEPAQKTCNCRWDGEVLVQQCTLHEAHVDAIHEWAERAKIAEAVLEKLLTEREEQKPAAWMDKNDDVFFTEEDAYKTGVAPIRGLYTSPQPAQQQEPFGQVTVVRRPGCVDQHWFYRWPEPPYLDNAAECHTVYTSPPASKPWVGLTDEEVVDLKMLGRDLEFVSMKALRRFARDIEATLKEKNHG